MVHGSTKKDTWAIIPALNEEEAISSVVQGIRKFVPKVLVVDNGSTDGTGQMARMAGATVIEEPRRGYGAACQRAISYLSAFKPHIVIFSSGDGSDDPRDIPRIMAPLLDGGYQMVIGSRALGMPSRPLETRLQRLGNRIIPWLMKSLLGAGYTDLGPYRAILWESLVALDMKDTGFAWTLEMQIKALRKGLKVCEIPVTPRPRIGGQQKISGTFWGSLRAGRDLLACLGKEIIWGST